MLDEVSMGKTAPKPSAGRKRAYGILDEACIPCGICKGKYPSGVWHCAYHFCYLVLYLVPDCGKGISETGY